MTGVGARKRHDKQRRERLKLLKDCNYKDQDGNWQPRATWTTPRGAKRAIDNIYDLTGRAYVRYECRSCGMFHIKPDRRTYPPQPC